MVALLLQQFHFWIYWECDKIEGFLVIFWLQFMQLRLCSTSNGPQFITFDIYFTSKRFENVACPFSWHNYPQDDKQFNLWAKTRLSSILLHIILSPNCVSNFHPRIVYYTLYYTLYYTFYYTLFYTHYYTLYYTLYCTPQKSSTNLLKRTSRLSFNLSIPTFSLSSSLSR